MNDSGSYALQPIEDRSLPRNGGLMKSIRTFIKRLLPSWLTASLATVQDKCSFGFNRMAASEPIASILRMRLHRVPTKILGPTNHPTQSRIEIDITYSCNQKCLHCDRSCCRAPSDDSMTKAQVQKFLQESLDKNIHWEEISVLGGEPTLHPDLFAILDMLIDYQRNHSPNTRLVMKTHGNGSRTQDALENIPPEFHVVNSAKRSALQGYFMAFNIAPKDLPSFSKVDFTNGCCIPEKYGCVLTPYGYYACPAMGGGIDRILGRNLGSKSLPLSSELINKQLKAFCPYCGHFLRREGEIRYTNLKLTDISPSWQKAYQAYREKPPVLHRY